jgi:hypothetical protein
MPRWTLPGGSLKNLVLYHGTDNSVPGTAGMRANTRINFTANLARCSPNTEFGQGFYTTTSEHQARQWANAKYVSNPARVNALLLRFEVDRNWLAAMETLFFVRPTGDFWDLVDDCHLGFRPHQRPPPNNPPFDVVCGPVSLWPRVHIIQDCDQVSFHTQRAVHGLGNPWIHAVGTPIL